jgi:hypothetical protein
MLADKKGEMDKNNIYKAETPGANVEPPRIAE